MSTQPAFSAATKVTVPGRASKIAFGMWNGVILVESRYRGHPLLPLGPELNLPIKIDGYGILSRLDESVKCWKAGTPIMPVGKPPTFYRFDEFITTLHPVLGVVLSAVVTDMYIHGCNQTFVFGPPSSVDVPEMRSQMEPRAYEEMISRRWERMNGDQAAKEEIWDDIAEIFCGDHEGPRYMFRQALEEAYNLGIKEGAAQGQSMIQQLLERKLDPPFQQQQQVPWAQQQQAPLGFGPPTTATEASMMQQRAAMDSMRAQLEHERNKLMSRQVHMAVDPASKKAPSKPKQEGTFQSLRKMLGFA